MGAQAFLDTEALSGLDTDMLAERDRMSECLVKHRIPIRASFEEVDRQSRSRIHEIGINFQRQVRVADLLLTDLPSTTDWTTCSGIYL